MAPLPSHVAGSESSAMGNMMFPNGIFPFPVQRKKPEQFAGDCAELLGL